MPLSDSAVSVLTRPLPKDKIQTRPGKGGMEFFFITPDFVIETLNEAFGGEWSTRIVSHDIFAENVAVVGLELSVPTTDGKYIAKQQFGSCEINRGMDVGSAFKGAASDALKKCATLLGLGLELYKDEEPVVPTPPQFRTPPAPAPRPSSPAPSAPRPPVAAPPARPVAPPAPPKPVAPSVPKPAGNPFSGAAASNPAPIAKPTPPPARPAPAVPPAPRTNPFTSNAQASGPNSTQLNAMTNLANRKGLTPSALIALAGVVDGQGQPVSSFEELSREQAIQVIKAAQL